jgi:hypothetical protein
VPNWRCAISGREVRVSREANGVFAVHGMLAVPLCIALRRDVRKISIGAVEDLRLRNLKRKSS